MPIVVATHSGPFHADDVLAFALIRVFLDNEALVVRSRERAVIDQADIVVDVGGIYDPKRGRFDHHQNTYRGELSSAGMVLEWLCADGRVSQELGAYLRTQLVEYVDAVDNGRRTPTEGVPCFATMIDSLKMGCEGLEEFDSQFMLAEAVARNMVKGLCRGHQQLLDSAEAVIAAMKSAEQRGSNLLVLERYYRWKPVYFAHQGETHLTEFVLYPGSDATTRVVAIPPTEGSFGQKQSFPAAWAGLSGLSLSEQTGVDGSRFCHKNRFIAVFDTPGCALQAMSRAGLLSGELPSFD